MAKQPDPARPTQASVAADVAEFLKHGGKIEKVPQGVGAWHVVQGRYTPPSEGGAAQSIRIASWPRRRRREARRNGDTP